VSTEVEQISIEDEMKHSYIDYAMSVIVGRALPDARDGLKPVHRRILYSMWEEGNRARSRFLKCGKTVGNVLGNYHPHGDTAIYDAMARMAQEFSLRYPLIEGQGNFGSIDGDPPGAYRYTEARMDRISELLMKDIDKETVPFRPTYDGRLQEPVLLPAVLPNLLLNGASGIAVGMATNIPSHNLNELVDALTAFIDDPEITLDELIQYVPGPDFPTGGIIYGVRGIRQAYETGSGRLILRGKTTIERNRSEKARIIITEIPYQVKTEDLIEQIGTVKGVSNVVNEADQENLVRIRVDIDLNTPPEIVLNRLLRRTSLQVTFGWKTLALVDDQPRILSLKDVFEVFLSHRVTVTKAALTYDLNQMKRRVHVLEGLLLALDHIDEVIKIIRTSETNEAIRTALRELFQLSEEQITAILNIRLAQLARLEKAKVVDEFKTLNEKIEWTQSVLADDHKVFALIKEELQALKKDFGDARRTELIPESHEAFDALEEKSPRDFIPETQVVIARTLKGYIISMPLDVYRRQHRGGKGIYAMDIRTDDMAVDLMVASNFDTILFFTESGKVHALPGYELPQRKRASRGIALEQVLAGIEKDGKVTSVIPVSEFREDCYLFHVTEAGWVKKTPLMEYARIMKGGKRSILLTAEDKLRSALITHGNDQLLLASENGKSIRFRETDVRSTGRASRGVRGINLAPGDRVVDAVLVQDDMTLMTVTEKGYGKRTPFPKYRVQRRGGKGLINIKKTEKNGNVVACLRVDQDDEIIAISAKGKIIRIPTKSIRSSIGRATQGVRVMSLRKDDCVVGGPRLKSPTRGGLLEALRI